MIQRRLRITSRDGEYYHYKYSPRGTKSHYHVHYVGRCGVEVCETDHLKRGMVYSLPYHILHQIEIPSDQMVASLILTHETNNLVVNDLISPKRLDSNRGKISSPPYNNEFLLELVRQFIAIHDRPAQQ